MSGVDWNLLHDAYGSAAGIPLLLQQLHDFPTEPEAESEPWFTLWSALCHQGDVYSASFAAVVTMEAILAKAPERATPSFFGLPASIEIARANRGHEVPEQFAQAYRAAVEGLARSALVYLRDGKEQDTRASALSLIAASVGEPRIAEVLLEIQEDALNDLLEWLRSR
jgi:hypothetical protein